LHGTPEKRRKCLKTGQFLSFCGASVQKNIVKVACFLFNRSRGTGVMVRVVNWIHHFDTLEDRTVS